MFGLFAVNRPFEFTAVCARKRRSGTDRRRELPLGELLVSTSYCRLLHVRYFVPKEVENMDAARLAWNEWRADPSWSQCGNAADAPAWYPWAHIFM